MSEWCLFVVWALLLGFFIRRLFADDLEDDE